MNVHVVDESAEARVAGPRPKSKNLIKKDSKTRNLKPQTTSLAMQQLEVAFSIRPLS